MSTPAEEVARQQELLRQAGQLIEATEWARARDVLLQARELDPRCPKVYELLAQAMAGLGDSAEAEALAKQAKAIRRENWARAVEAELRGHHELIGEWARRELPL